MNISDTEFKKLGKLGLIEKMDAEEIEKKEKPVWRLLISIKDSDELVKLYTQRNIERTFSHPITVLSYVRKCFSSDIQVTFKMKKELERWYHNG